jgi:Putative Flp pilus-assembly TadE/G-like
MNGFRRFHECRKGSVAVMFGLSLVPITLAVGAGVDYSLAVQERRDMVGALDSALLAAAREKSPDQRLAKAKAVYAANAASQGRNPDTVTFWLSSDGKRYHGRAESSVPTNIMKVVGIDAVSVSTEQAVILDNNPVCLLLLKPSGTSLTLNSSSDITMPGCEVHVKSSSKDAVSLSSNSEVNSHELCVEGGIEYKSANAKASYQENCPTVTPEFKLPEMAEDTSCTYNKASYNQNVTLTPGNICNGMTFKGAVKVTFEPGLYRVRGGDITFQASSTVIAEEVTFYWEDSSTFSMNANSSLSLTPPTSGTYRGITMFEPPGLPPAPMDLVSAANAQQEGLFYLPSRNVTLNSSSGITSKKVTLVAWTATFNSSATWEVDPVPEEDLRMYDNHVALVQ